VKCSWFKVSEESFGRNETLHQTSHEHLTSVKRNDSGKIVVVFLQKAYGFFVPRVLSLPYRDHVTALGSRVQINKGRNIAAPDKLLGNPTNTLNIMQIL